MSDAFVSTFVDRLLLIKNRAPADVPVIPMPPIQDSVEDVLALQRVGRNIAEHAGLADLTFIIGTTTQEEHVGGKIDLSSEGNAVFIEVDLELLEFGNAAAATLCHEISHKWLDKRGIRLPLEIENEILTDITAVFLGFGKIMLNGCEETRVEYHDYPDYRQQVRQNLKVGYLKEDQLALVYRLVCSMNGIPTVESEAGLFPRAIEALRRCDRSFGHHYRRETHSHGASAQLAKDVQDQVRQVQTVLAKTQRYSEYIQFSFMDRLANLIRENHQNLKKMWDAAESRKAAFSVDSETEYLLSVKNGQELESLFESLAPLEREARELLKHAQEVLKSSTAARRRFPFTAPSAAESIKCPIDGTRLRLPRRPELYTIRCPKCGYQFRCDRRELSASEVSSDSTATENVGPKQKPGRGSWWRRLLRRGR